MSSPRAPTDRSRQDEIAAAVAAHNAANREPLLTPDAARLLAAMFAETDVCRRNRESLASEGFSRGTLALLLHDLSEAGFLTKTRGVGSAPNTYRLHLPPLVRR
jgi:hypothetical protein